MRKRLLTMCLTAIMMVVGMSAYALDKKDGVYQIGTAADWDEFAELVNGGDVTANAVLTADIDLGINVKMIGTNDNSNAYHGTFDGKGHTIKINMYPEDQYAALFRYVGWRAVIQNLKVEGTINSAYKFAAGIAGRLRGTIRNCWADVKIISTVPGGDGTHGGLAGTCTNGTIIENCLVKVVIDGEITHSCGGVIGWADSNPNIVNCLVISDGSNFNISNASSRNICRNDSKVQVVNLTKYNENSYSNRPGPSCYNNYVTNQWETGSNHNPSVTVVPLDNLADGKICYQLNNDQSRIAWAQEIGVDPFPVPAVFGGKQVYASGPTDCKGTSEDALTYSNTPSNAVVSKHEFDKYGICTKCGLYNFHAFEYDDPDRFDPVTRSVLLGSKEDIDLAEGMNRIVNGFKLHMRMVNDIEYIAEPGHFIFNASDWTEGNFDGGGHALTIEMTEMGNDASLFPIRHYGSVENLIMHGRIETSGKYAGSISNDSYESAVRNVYSDIDIVSTNKGDNTSGGFFGMIRTGKTIENCIYAGTITVPESNPTPRVGGIAGWTHARTTLTNCAILGHINGAGGDKADNSMNIARNPGNIVSENVYVAHPLIGVQVTDQDKFIEYDNEEGIENGELAFFLNGKQSGAERFYQKIGEDPMPMPIAKEGALVYVDAKEYMCDGTPLNAFYKNTPAGNPVLPPHEYEDGFCVNCGHVQEDYMTPVDGWYEIGTPEQFLWWSNYASTHLDASAKLTADIDLADYNETDENTNRPITPRFAQVGSEYMPFYGNFDGQCHTISNLNINLLGKRGCGLISVMNSQPDDKLSGLTADAARAEEGVYVKDVVLDETCSITGGGYTGIVGMGSPWAGHITISGCMNLGNVYVVAGTNGAGIYGCSMGSACRVTINACGMIGDIHVENDTRTENGSFSGWLGNYAEVTNCFALGSVDYIDPNRGFARHAAGAYNSGGVVIKNCYALDGLGIKQVDDGSKQEDVSFVSMEDLETGKITWKANGSQFREPVWYQTLGEDEYPYPFDTHGVVIYVAEEYMAVSESTLPDVQSTIISYYSKKLEDMGVAYTGAIEDMQAKIEAVNDVTGAIALADALDSIYAAEKVVKASAKVYKAYENKCEEVKDYLSNHDDFAGVDRDALEYYLENDYVEIMENHELTDSLVEKETVRVGEWLDLAIKNGYIAGTEVTNLFTNADFRDDFKNGWKSSMNKLATGRSTVTIQEKTYYGSEAWNTKFDMHQTVKDLKPGYYLVGVQGAFRPSNDRYGYNYAAQVYANDNVNYLQTVIEDYVLKGNAVNGENVYIKQIGGGNTTYDLPIYSDGFSTDATNGADTLGYAVHGPSGMAVAGYAGRYENYVIAKAVGDSLTIGICNPGTNYGSDWTGFSSFKVIYAGEEDEAEKYVDVALESMVTRANTILTLYRNKDLTINDEAQSPCYPTELKNALIAAVAAADGAQGVEGKMKVVEDLSQLFKEFYEARQAYLAFYNVAQQLEAIEGSNLSLVEKDPESDEWVETGENLYNEDEITAIEDTYDELFNAYYFSLYSTEKAKDAVNIKNPVVANILPAKDEDGYYLVSTPKQFAAYRAIASECDAKAKVKLEDDIDMTGIAMMPIGHNRSGENAVHIYRGVLDGQGHALENVYISEAFTSGDPASLFYELKGATVKNFKLTGEYFNTERAKFMGGLTRWTSEKSTIENCEIAVVMHSFIEGDGTHGGVIGISGDGTVVNNCIVNVTMIGESENPTTNCGGIVGWANNSPTISNTLILSQYKNIAKGDNSNVIGRNGFTASNVFYAESANPGFDVSSCTLASEEQLASGEICWKLNGSKVEDAHWFQKIGTDATPHLFEGSLVWLSEGEYVNRRPNIQLNAFASNLSSATNAGQVVISYTLNADAKSGAINFYAGDELKYVHILKGADLMAGGHEVAVDNGLLNASAGTKMTYELDITGMGVKNATKIGDSYKVWGPYGLAINNNPASKGFGQVLLAESYPTAPDDAKYISCKKNGAIFAFDVNFQPINAIDGTPGFYGSVPNAGEEPLVIAGSYKYDFKDLRFTEDGRLFVARASGTTSSSVWEINPDDLNEPWKPVFTGGTLDEATGITYVGEVEQNRAALGLAFEGKGADLKMYVLGGQRSDGGNNATDYNCVVYNLGTATEWTGAPSAVVEPLTGQYTYSPYYVGIHEDGQGGLWYIQHVSSPSADNPILKHYNTAGDEDYSQINSGRNGARIAISTDGKFIAMPNGNGSVVIYQTDYVPMVTGKISLTPKQIIPVSETSITSMAFDYANNLYVASAGSETFSRYAIPSWNDNKCVTPAAEGFVVGTESGDPDAIVNLNANASNGAVYNLAGQRVSKAQKGIYIQSGKKVSVK